MATPTPTEIIGVDLGLALQIAMGIAGAAGGWFLRVMHERLQRIEQAMHEDAKALTELRVALAGNYVTKTDHKEALDNIFGALRRIEDKLDHKADK